MDRIKVLMWLSLMVAVSLGVSGGFGARRKPAVEYRNPKLVEMVIDQPKEYPGFFYSKWDETDRKTWFAKMRRETGLDIIGVPFNIMVVEVEGLALPVYTWTISDPLPVAYNRTVLSISAMGNPEMEVERLEVVEDTIVRLVNVKDWKRAGLRKVSSSEWQLKIGENRTKSIRGWIMTFTYTEPMKSPDPYFDDRPFSRRFAVMQLPKLDSVTLTDLKHYSTTFQYLQR